MTVFYWIMATLTAATFLPSVMFILLYAFTGEDGWLRRARALFGPSLVTSKLSPSGRPSP